MIEEFFGVFSQLCMCVNVSCSAKNKTEYSTPATSSFESGLLIRAYQWAIPFISAMSIFSSFLVLLLILVEAAPPTASSVPVLGRYQKKNVQTIQHQIIFVHSSSLVKSRYPLWRASEDFKRAKILLYALNPELLPNQNVHFILLWLWKRLGLWNNI